MRKTKQLKRVKKAYSVLALCFIITGLILLWHPQMAVEVMCRICGSLLVLFGIVKILGYFSKDYFQLAFQFDFAMGIISGVIGCVMIFHTKHIVEILAAVIGIFMMADGVLKIQTAMDAKKFGLEKWWLILLISLCAAVIGVLLLVMPMKGTGMILRFVGGNLLVDGILNLVIVQSTVRTIRRKNKWEV